MFDVVKEDLRISLAGLYVSTTLTKSLGNFVVCCEPCVKNRNDPIIQIKSNPKVPTFVCLELHHYLQARFPVEYRQREQSLSPCVIENRIQETEAAPDGKS
jgi:hypothetical protein